MATAHNSANYSFPKHILKHLKDGDEKYEKKLKRDEIKWLERVKCRVERSHRINL